jgi:hypothetical protein
MNAIQTTLSSARFNRLMLWVGVAVFVAGAFALVFKFAGGSDATPKNPDKGFKATLPAPTHPLKNSQGVTVKTFEQLDPSMRATIRKFIGTAVARKHLEEGWKVTAPSLRNQVSHKQWMTGNLPVIPFPVENLDRVQYYLDYASTQAVLIEVGVTPKASAHMRPATFQLEIVPVKNGSGKTQWLVDYWMSRWTPPLPEN